MIHRLKHHLMAKSRAKKIREFISLTGASTASTEYKIFTFRLGPFPLHHTVWGKKED
jgi:hypothetical protein